MVEINGNKYLTSTDILNVYNISRTLLNNLEKNGLITCVRKKDSNKKLYLQEDLEKFLESCKTK